HRSPRRRATRLALLPDPVGEQEGLPRTRSREAGRLAPSGFASGGSRRPRTTGPWPRRSLTTSRIVAWAAAHRSGGGHAGCTLCAGANGEGLPMTATGTRKRGRPRGTFGPNHAEVLRRFEAGATVAEVARALGVGRQAVYGHLRSGGRALAAARTRSRE